VNLNLGIGFICGDSYHMEARNARSLGELLDNPLLSSIQILREATNLNLKRGGAPGSRCEASIVSE
jgi:hypothetical protein